MRPVDKLRWAVVIPARFGSTRFPGKVLAPLHGKPWLQWVYESATGVGAPPGAPDQVMVATGDQTVYDAVVRFGGRVFRTSPDHRTGSDRCSEVAQTLDADVVVNLQADEILLDPGILSEVAAPFVDDASLVMATLKREIDSAEEVFDPNVVKVVTDHRGDALYFSRAPIPYPRGAKKDELPAKTFYKHLGIYAFRREFLLGYPDLPFSNLEDREGLEQLRALAAGVRIRVVETRRETLRVDTREDLKKIQGLPNLMAGRQ